MYVYNLINFGLVFSVCGAMHEALSCSQATLTLEKTIVYRGFVY